MYIKMSSVRTGLVVLFLFLLPWQTRWIFSEGSLPGVSGVWEYGTLGVYVTEVVLWIALLLSMKEVVLCLCQHRRQFGALLALVILAFGSVWWAGLPVIAFWSALHLFEAILLAALLESQRKSWTWLVGAFVAGALIQAFLGLWQFATQFVFSSTLFGMALHDPSQLGTSVVEAGGGRLLRAYGSFPHPNILGAYLAVAATLLIPYYLRAKYFTGRVATMAGFFVLLVGLFVSFSRSAWCGVLLALIFLFTLLLIRSSSEGRKQALRLLALIFILFVALAAIGNTIISERFGGTGRLEQLSRTERLMGFKEAEIVMWAHPWVGTGMGNYTAALAAEFPGREVWSYQPVHDIFVLILAELGIAGMVLILLFAAAFIRFWMIWWRANPTLFATCVSVMMWVIFPPMLLDHYLWSLYPGLMLWGVVAGFWLNQVKINRDKNILSDRT